jgi:hypothetical protein
MRVGRRGEPGSLLALTRRNGKALRYIGRKTLVVNSA